MCQFITSFIAPIAGGLVTGCIGIWMSKINHCRNGKTTFLLVAADQKSKLSETNKADLDVFYQQSIPIMNQAVYRMLEFLKEKQKRELLKVWNEYRSEGKQLFGNHDEFMANHAESLGKENPHLKWLEDYFEKFDKCARPRKFDL
jgi:hypothetical protein